VNVGDATVQHRNLDSNVMNAQPTTKPPTLLAVIELGGYQNFTPLYKSLGYQVEMVTGMRKALAAIKKSVPDVIVAEFNYQTDFRDRTSSLESLFAVVQRMSGTRVIVFYEKDTENQLERLRAHLPDFIALAFPIDEAALRAALGH
jgi:DNA-binding NtrC family response regulator